MPTNPDSLDRDLLIDSFCYPKHDVITNLTIGKGVVRAFYFMLILLAPEFGKADETRTSLIIEGGGLPPYCPALERLVEVANIDNRGRIGYLPTASSNPDKDALQFIDRLSAYNIRPEQIQILDVTVSNAATQAENPEVVSQIRSCTAIFFGGGDQTRITHALLKSDGTPTAVLKAIYEVWQGGTIIAGTSAGAAVQSQTMISISGFPDNSIDDGMDALDFGLTKLMEQPARRGLLVSRGLGFLHIGIVDQHFSQYRGRLGRLARAAIEEKVRYGFGIDEDAALVVSTDGTMEILGPGCVTILDTDGATCHDSSLGCSISGVHLTCLGRGDHFDPKTGKSIVHPAKKLIEAGQESNLGNFQIPDIAGRGAMLDALISGLGDNISRKQIGIVLKHNRNYGHGYRYTFSKTEQTNSYKGIFHGQDESVVTNVRLDIEPVTLTLRLPETGLPLDIPQGPSRKRLEGILFRGIMLANEQGLFRPNTPITRGELASAIAQVIRLEPARNNPPVIKDVLSTSPDAEEIALVVTAGLMKTEDGFFRPLDPISRQESAAVLIQLAERYRSTVLSTEPVTMKDLQTLAAQHRDAVFAACREGLLTTDDDGFRPRANLTRVEAAEAMFKIIAFPWAE